MTYPWIENPDMSNADVHAAIEHQMGAEGIAQDDWEGRKDFVDRANAMAEERGLGLTQQIEIYDQATNETYPNPPSWGEWFDDVWSG